MRALNCGLVTTILWSVKEKPCLKMITSFLTWLKEADPDSDQEADA
jgi:hypothetical protein